MATASGGDHNRQWKQGTTTLLRQRQHYLIGPNGLSIQQIYVLERMRVCSGVHVRARTITLTMATFNLNVIEDSATKSNGSIQLNCFNKLILDWNGHLEPIERWALCTHSHLHAECNLIGPSFALLTLERPAWHGLMKLAFHQYWLARLRN